MKTSIATVSLSGDLRDKLGAIAKAGFNGVEIFENDFLVFDESPRDLGRMVRDFGLEITLFQPFRDFEGMPEPLRARTFDRAERKFDIMQDMGTDLVLVCSNVSSAALGGLDRAAVELVDVAPAGPPGALIESDALVFHELVDGRVNVARPRMHGEQAAGARRIGGEGGGGGEGGQHGGGEHESGLWHGESRDMTGASVAPAGARDE